MIKDALFETKRQTKVITVLKSKSHHFAFSKENIAENRFYELGHTQVTSDKPAVNKMNAREFGFRKIAGRKFAVFIFSFGQRSCSVINTVKGFALRISVFHTVNLSLQFINYLRRLIPKKPIVSRPV